MPTFPASSMPYEKPDTREKANNAKSNTESFKNVSRTVGKIQKKMYATI